MDSIAPIESHSRKLGLQQNDTSYATEQITSTNYANRYGVFVGFFCRFDVVGFVGVKTYKPTKSVLAE